MGLLDALKPDFLKPNWRCTACGETHRRNPSSCSNCNGTVFEKIRD